jgi:basic amino acid/polyamine antiporter, APA family
MTDRPEGPRRTLESSRQATRRRLESSREATRRTLDSSRAATRRTVGSPPLFAIVYASASGAIYFTLGVVANHALGLTPIVYLIGSVFFVLCMFTYVEGASLHQDRGGSFVFARYAFNELWSFIAGWAILLDYAILIAVAALAADHYLAAFWAPLGRGVPELVIPLAIVGAVAAANVQGGATQKGLRRLALLAIADLGIQLLVVVLGLVLVFRPHLLVNPIQLGSSPAWKDFVFALPITAVAFTGLESASGLAGEVAVGRRGLRRLVSAGTSAVFVLYVGLALVALTALPVHNGTTLLGTRYMNAPVLGVARAIHNGSVGDTLGYLVAASAVLVLIVTANAAMLGLSRLGFGLATNRQIPSLVGRLHATRSTPFVLIGLAALIAGALVLPQNLDLLVGIYAFGAMLAFTIAHIAICVLRYREPDRARPYRMPGSVRVGGGDLPLPAVLGAVLAGAGWITVVVLHAGARYVGAGWLLFGLALYVIYRKTQGKSLTKRVTVPQRTLQRPDERASEYGSILVPIFGRALDDDIVQTAGRLASERPDADDEDSRAVIEALWIFEIPLSLPIDARLPEARLNEAKSALRRAKAVGEEFEGVEVATAIVRARRIGQAIVDEARRRGVEAIVLAAEEVSRIRGGALLGGRASPLENFVGDVTKYVVAKAPCRVILTALPASEGVADASDGRVVAPEPAAH